MSSNNFRSASNELSSQALRIAAIPFVPKMLLNRLCQEQNQTQVPISAEPFHGACAFFDISGFSRLASGLQKIELSQKQEANIIAKSIKFPKNQKLDSMAISKQSSRSSNQRQSGEIAREQIRDLARLQTIATLNQGKGAEELARAIAAFFSKLISSIEEAGGDVIKFAGDALICIWEKENLKGNDIAPGLLVLHAVNCGFLLASAVEEVSLGGMDTTSLKLHVCVGSGAMELVRLGGVQRRWENYIRGEGYEDACNGIDLSTPGEVVVSVPSYENMELYIKENLVHALSGLKGIATPVETGEPYVKLANLNIQVPPVQLRTINLNVVPIQTLLSYCPLSVRYAIKHGSQKDAQLSNCSIVFVKFKGLAELEANSTTTNNSSSGSINDDEQNDDSNTSSSGTASGLLALNRAFGTVQNAIYSQKAVLRQFVVDDKGAVAVIVAGFPPYTYSDQPSRAVAVALVIRNRLATFGVDVQIGVTTGTVFCGNVGDESKRCEYAAVGHVVNLSARLMGKDKEGRIICCDSTSKRAGASYVFEKLPEKLKLKGVEHLVEVYTPIRYSMPVSVVNNNNSMSGTNKSNGSNGSNGKNGRNAGLFGREKEMKELLDVLHDDESGKTVLVIGEEGSGKTSLLVRMRSYVVEAEIEARVRHKRSRTVSNETTAALQTAMSDASVVMNSEEDDYNDCYCAITVTAGRVLYKHEPYYAFKSILRDLLGLHLSTSRLDLFKSCTNRSCIKQRALERNTGSSNNDNKAASCLHSSPVKLTTEQPTESKSFKRRRKRQKRSSLMATATEPMQHLLMSHSLRKDIFLLHQILPTLVLPLEISNPGNKEEKEKGKKINEETNIAHRLASIICSLIDFHIDALPTLNVFLILVDNAEHLDPYSLALLLEIGKQLPSRATMILSALKNAFKISLDINNTSTATNGMMTTPQKTSNSIKKNASDIFSYDSPSFNFNAMEPPTPSRDLNANFSSIFSRYRSSGNINYRMKRNSKPFGSTKNKNQSNGNQFATNGRRSRGHTMSTSSTEMTSGTPLSVQRVSRTRATSSPETIPPLTTTTTSATCVNHSTSTSTTTPTTPTTQIETKKDRSDSLIRHLNAQKSFINIKNSTKTTKRPPPPGMKSKKSSSPSMPPGLATNASDINLIDSYTAVPLRARSPTQFDTESSVEETNTERNSSIPRRLHETVTLDTFLIQKDTSKDSNTHILRVLNLSLNAMNNILSSRVKCCIDEKVSELIYTKCSGNIAYAIQLFDNWIQYGYLMFQKQNLTETPKAEEEQKEQKEEKEDKEEKKEKKKDIKEKNELQTVVVFVEGVENGTLTLPSQMVDLYKRKMDRFVQTTKMAARLLSVVGVSLTLNDVIDMNEKINLVTMPGEARQQMGSKSSGSSDTENNNIIVGEALSDLVRYGFMHCNSLDHANNNKDSNTANYSFTCIAAREAIYTSMTFLERKNIHTLVGQYYEDTYGNGPDAIFFVAIVAYHAEAVGNLKKAVTLYEASASFGEMNAENDDAIARFEDCLRLSDIDESNVTMSKSLEYCKRIAGLHLRQGRPQRAKECIESMLHRAMVYLETKRNRSESSGGTFLSRFCSCCAVDDEVAKEDKKVRLERVQMLTFCSQIERILGKSNNDSLEKSIALADRFVPLLFHNFSSGVEEMIIH